MSAGLMSDNSVYSLKELPWRKLGVVSQNPVGAQQSLGLIESPWYEKRPATVMLDGQAVEFGDYAIVRSKIPTDPHERVVGTVKRNYNILQPLDIATAFDVGVGQPVETIGFLGTHGDKMFLTWKLPSVVVGQDDQVAMFGFVAAGYDGKYGASLNLVTTRVWCANTWAAAIAEASEGKGDSKTRTVGKVWSGRHNSVNLERDLEIWMNHVQERATSESEKLANAFNAMAAKAMNTQAMTSILGRVYPSPKPLPENYPERLRAEKQTNIDKLTANAERDRAKVVELFSGAGTAIDATGWGLFNAITEHENHVRMTKKPAEYSILLGNRAKTMTNAMNHIMAWVER